MEPILGMFTKLQKVTISFVITACMPVHPTAWNNSAPTGQIFMKFDISIFLKNLLRKSFIKIWQEYQVI